MAGRRSVLFPKTRRNICEQQNWPIKLTENFAVEIVNDVYSHDLLKRLEIISKPKDIYNSKGIHRVRPIGTFGAYKTIIWQSLAIMKQLLKV